jgi:hypothetical protein
MNHSEVKTNFEQFLRNKVAHTKTSPDLYVKNSLDMINGMIKDIQNGSFEYMHFAKNGDKGALLTLTAKGKIPKLHFHRLQAIVAYGKNIYTEAIPDGAGGLLVSLEVGRESRYLPVELGEIEVEEDEEDEVEVLQNLPEK